MKRVVRMLAMLICLASLCGCGIYSFSGTSIKPDVKTVTIDPVVNKALKVNPTLANSMTEALKDKFKKLTSLTEQEEDGDLQLTVSIESYDIRAQAVTANEVAAQNRLTITAKATFINSLHPEENFENKQFAAYEDYNSELDLDAVEASLCDQIVDKLVEDIFNASVAQW